MNNKSDRRRALYHIGFFVIFLAAALLFAAFIDRERAGNGTDTRNMPACSDDGTSTTGKYPCFFDGKKDGNGRGDSYISTNGQPDGIIYITTQK